jgi:hypothetical protein
MPGPLHVAFALSCSLAPAAQGVSLREAHVVVPRVMALGGVVNVGDLDGDGHVDHLFAGSNTALMGTATGEVVVRRPVFLPPNSWAQACALADVDGDGDLDACTLTSWSPSPTIPPTISGGHVHVYSNDGTGYFNGPLVLGGSIPWAGVCSTAIAAGDVDGDGDVDLVVGVRPYSYLVWTSLWTPPVPAAIGGQNLLWLNQGNGTFVDGTSRMPGDSGVTTSVALEDLDGDGDLDVYFGNKPTPLVGWPGRDQVLRNPGNGWFVVDPSFVPAATDTEQVHARDFDNDGDVDLLVHDLSQPRFHRNTGGGSFTTVPLPLPLPVGSRTIVGDFDGDHFVDFGVLTATLWSPVRNDAGVFSPVPDAEERLASYDYQFPVLLVDQERDGDLDLLLGPESVLRARWLRNADGVPHRTVQTDLPEVGSAALSIAIGDLDGDSDPDLLLAAFGAGLCYRNDGHGTFTPVAAGDFTQIASYTVSLQLADFDGDGDLDAAAGTTASGAPPFVSIYWNQGGAFTRQVLPFLAGDHLAVGDLDGDGDPDIYTSPAWASDVVLENTGGGTFAEMIAAVPSGVRTRFPRLADIDADGDLDVIGCTVVLRNDGTGAFAVAPNPALVGIDPPLVGDFDGDQDPDVLLAPMLYRNDGGGSFTPNPIPVTATTNPLHGIAAGDLDGDGDLDVLRAARQPWPSTMPAVLLTNDGSGTLTPQPGGADDLFTDAMDMEVADLDGDGDLDAVVATPGTPRIWWNRKQHLSWRDLPRVGWPLTLDIEGAAHDPFALAVAFAATQIPIPGLGTLRLDPSSLVVMASGALDAAGDATFQAPVPPLPALVGRTLHWQALTGSRLGNLERTTFLAR